MEPRPRQIPSPMPLAPPVTITVLPFRSLFNTGRVIAALLDENSSACSWLGRVKESLDHIFFFGVRVERALLVVGCARRYWLERIPQDPVAVALSVDGKIALKHTSIDTEQVDGRLN